MRTVEPKIRRTTTSKTKEVGNVQRLAGWRIDVILQWLWSGASEGAKSERYMAPVWA